MAYEAKIHTIIEHDNGDITYGVVFYDTPDPTIVPASGRKRAKSVYDRTELGRYHGEVLGSGKDKNQKDKQLKDDIVAKMKERDVQKKYKNSNISTDF